VIGTKSGQTESEVRKLAFAASVPADRVGQALLPCASMFLCVHLPSKSAG